MGGGAPPPAMGGGGNPNLSANADPQKGLSPIQEDAKTLEAIARSIHQANPKIEPGELFDAVKQQIDMMHGVDTAARNNMIAMTNLYRDQMRLEQEREKIQMGYYRTDKQVEGREKVAEIGAESREKVEDKRAAAQIDVAKLNGSSRERSAAIRAAASQAVAGMNLEGRVKTKIMDVYEHTFDTTYKATTDVEKAKAAAEARIQAALIANPGSKDPRTAKPPGAPPIVGKPPPADPNMSILPAKGRYKSPEQVRDDPKLSREQKLGILKRDFGFH